MNDLASAAAVVLIALVFVIGHSVRSSDPARREFWFSAAGGASLAYVFVVLLPKLAAAQTKLQAITDEGLVGFLHHHAFLLALAGVILFWAFDRLVVVLVEGLIESLGDEREPQRTRITGPLWRPILYAQAIGFASYAALVGYLLGSSGDSGSAAVGLFALAMALHFFGLAHELHHQLGEAYENFERWLLAAAVLIGWVVAQLTEIASTQLALWNSLFAGMLLFFVLRHEVPSPREGRFVPLLFGALAYSGLALAVEML
jgi:hypothetical protein